MTTPPGQRFSLHHDRQLILGAFCCLMAAGPLLIAGDRWLAQATLSRVALGAHCPSDVVVGAAFGLL